MKDWFSGYRNCWFPPLCAGDSLSFPERAAGYRRPVIVGLSVTPDGGAALVAGLDRIDRDLMLVENFR